MTASVLPVRATTPSLPPRACPVRAAAALTVNAQAVRALQPVQAVPVPVVRVRQPVQAVPAPQQAPAVPVRAHRVPAVPAETVLLRA